MATSHWRTNRPLIEVLKQEPYRFRLMQAVTILQRAGADRINFRAPLSPAFPSADVETITTTGKAKWTIETRAISLYDANGPLPSPWADQVRAQSRFGDGSARYFLDIFGNRLIAKLVEIMRLETPSAHPGGPETTPQASVLKGLLTFTAHGGIPSDLQRSMLSYAGMVSMRPVSSSVAERIMSDHFACPVSVRAFKGTWINLHGSEQIQLSSAPSEKTRAMGGLGRHGSMGKRIWVQNAAIGVSIGPLSLELFNDLQQGGKAHESLRFLAGYLLPQESDLEVTLILHEDDVPKTRLSSPPVSRLSTSAWLISRPPKEQKSATMRLRSRYA